MRTYNVTAEQVRDVHNAYSHGAYALDTLRELLRDDARPIVMLEQALKHLARVRNELILQHDADANRDRNYYESMRKKYALHSVWSIEDTDLLENSGIPIGTVFRSFYTGHTAKTKGPTWLDAWKAADELARAAGDSHIYVEEFRENKDGTYDVEFGS